MRNNIKYFILKLFKAYYYLCKYKLYPVQVIECFPKYLLLTVFIFLLSIYLLLYSVCILHKSIQRSEIISFLQVWFLKIIK